MKLFKKASIASAVLASALLMTGCGSEKEPVVATGSKFSIAESKDAVWPRVEAEDVDMMDPMPTRENIMVVLDMSGSMGTDDCSGRFGTKALAAKSVLRDWVHSVDEDANLGLIIFDAQGTSVRLPLGQDNRDKFVELINDAQPSSGTPLKTAVSLAAQSLEERAAYQQGYGRYSMMVITDGAHDMGEDPAYPLNDIFNNAANPIEVSTVGFCIQNSALNQPGLTKYQSAKNPEELRKGLNSVLAESDDFQPIQEFNDDA